MLGTGACAGGSNSATRTQLLCKTVGEESRCCGAAAIFTAPRLFARGRRVALFIVQRHNRVDVGGAMSLNVASQQSNDSQKKSDRNEGDRISGVHAKQQTSH